MAWPPTPTFVTTNVDNPGDNPSVARADIANLMADVQNVIAGRAQADGVASLDSGSKIPVTQCPITPIAAAASPFVDGVPGVAKNWVVPAGVTRIRFRVAGAGGGGGYTSVGTGGDHGGGGGAGAVNEKSVTVVPGSTVVYDIGTGGAGWATVLSDGDGADGTNSSLTTPASAIPPSTTITSNGGGGGIGASTRAGGQGGGVGGSNGDVCLEGGAGASGATRGGMGGNNAMGSATAGGTGYGGGGGFGSGGGTPAFDGRPGLLVIEW